METAIYTASLSGWWSVASYSNRVSEIAWHSLNVRSLGGENFQFCVMFCYIRALDLWMFRASCTMYTIRHEYIPEWRDISIYISPYPIQTWYSQRSMRTCLRCCASSHVTLVQTFMIGISKLTILESWHIHDLRFASLFHEPSGSV